MSRDDQRGKRLDRNKNPQWATELEYYTIVTDTEKTESNYLSQFKDSLPLSAKKKLSIEIISHVPTDKLVEKSIDIREKKPHMSKLWIVFDRDEVKDFDIIINEAKNSGIDIGWSNPCIEIWFHAYFGEMPVTYSSVTCIENFRKIYKNKTDQDYKKADPDIYNKLCKHGNEETALSKAESRLKEQESRCAKESKMFSTTTLHRLIAEIRSKVKI